MTAGDSGTPLPRKLGVKPGQTILLEHVPDGFALGELPPDVHVHTRAGPGPYDLMLTFCPDLARLRARFGPLAARLDRAGALWVGWPKKSSGMPTDLTDNAVREYGLAAGLVDVKVAALDATWSGLKFVYRLADR